MKKWGVATFSYRERKERKYAYTKTWRFLNRERVRSYQREWYREHPEAARAIKKRGREKNKERIAEYKARYFQENKEKIYARIRAKKIAQKLIPVSPKCANCESVLKLNEVYVCDWCTRTYTISPYEYRDKINTSQETTV